MDTKPLWQETRMPRFNKLNKSAQFDVVVVGGGITGLSAAYFLKQAGRRVCVLERNRLGAGETAHTTAHLTMVTDLRLKKLVETFGKDQARLTWQGGATAIDAIETIARDGNIDCEFRRVPGFLHASLCRDRNASPDEADDLRDEAELARKLGFDATFVAKVPYVDRPGIRFADQAKFHPLAYLSGLAKSVDGDGRAVFEESEVTGVESDPLALKVGDLRVECDYVVIATHVPLMGKSGLLSATLLQTKLFPYSTYAVEATVEPNLLDEMSLWDTSDPYYYLRVDQRGNSDRLIFGGEDHKTGQAQDTEARYRHLEQTLLDIFPTALVEHRWSGQVIETNDGLPFIGETAERQFVATGFGGNGITFGTLAGLMARDGALARENPWQELFSVDRKKLRGGTWDYLKENVDFPYYYVRDRVAGTDGDSVESVGMGEGKILRLNGQRVACFRDEKGKVTLVSAVCTHMGCIVRWNSAEQTWDCPCHGSRFTPGGKVIGGPAESSLEPVKLPAAAPRAGAKGSPERRTRAPSARKKS
jgi:glycine/D-amino acid oxidase-like deaminating enzyme/nitrite reductase/ring-hydroxylating ferredoxin subunit